MSSITDKPISAKSEDLLEIDKYAEALSKFIKSSDTPITIGLQGEWGTGKTSLMSMLLEDFQENQIACSWVNTWEYSMFKGAHETTPGVLKGMLEKLQQNPQLKKESPSKNKFKQSLKVFGGLINQVVANQTGLDVKSAVDGSTEEAERYVAEIAEIKNLITEIIKEIISDPANDYQKIVFFVDDLDRIPPSDAVEILEALKNIFDIPHCIFVLAIDYDVVVKGLESKFGPKTDENEREFRSFFDKIIQVPFSMPTGAYVLEKFLQNKFEIIGIDSADDQMDAYVNTVKLTIGHNPRSLKRYLNSFSLIKHLIELNPSEEGDTDDLMLFTLLGIQISYPKIFRFLTMKTEFLSWDKAFANKVGLDWDENLEKLKKVGENDLLDEEWEQVTWGMCQSDSYLKSRVFSILELLNSMRDTFQNSLDDKLENALAFAAITNVDDNLEGKQAVQKVGNKTIFSGIDIKIEQLKKDGISDEGINYYKTLWNPIVSALNEIEHLEISLTPSATSLYDLRKSGRGNKQLIYCKNPSKKSHGMKIIVKNNWRKPKQVLQEIHSITGPIDEDLLYTEKRESLIIEYGLPANNPKAYLSILEYLSKELIK